MAGLLVLTDTFSWEIAALGDLSFYLTLKTLFQLHFIALSVPAEEENVCAVIVLQRLETGVSKLKEVRAEQKEERKLSKCNVYTWTQWALRFAGYVLLCSSIVMLYLN